MRSLPTAFSVFGWAAFCAASALATRLIYEQTILTWEEGPQAIGFTLVHEYVGLLLLGIAGQICLYGWIAGFFVTLIRRKIKGQPSVTTGCWGQFAASAVIVAVFWVPYGWWQLATVEFAGLGARTADQLTLAAGEGQKYLVRALLDRGMGVNARNSYGETSLNCACRTGREPMAEYLVSRGADLDSAPECRRFARFAALMKPAVPHLEPDDGLPKVPGTTITVNATSPGGSEPSSGK
jgi:hypothetical protein